MVIGVHVFTTVASGLNAAMESKKAGQLAAEKRISLLVGFLDQRKVSRELRNDIRDFYTMKYRHHETCDLDQEKIIAELPPTLARNLSEHLYTNYWKIKSMNFWRILMFSRLDQRDQQHLCAAFRPMTVGYKKCVFEKHDFGIGIYVITSGRVKLTRDSGVTKARGVLDEMHLQSWLPPGLVEVSAPPPAFSFTFASGDCFGEVESIAQLESLHSYPRYGDAPSVSQRGTQLLALDHDALSKLAKNHPAVLQRFEEVARVREEKICQRLVQDLDAWARFVFKVVLAAEAKSDDSTTSRLSSRPLHTGGTVNPSVTVHRRAFEDIFMAVATEIYDELLSEDLLVQLRAKHVKHHKIQPTSRGLLRTDSCPTENILEIELADWLHELADSDLFTTAHYARLRTQQLKRLRNGSSSKWRKLRNLHAATFIGVGMQQSNASPPRPPTPFGGGAYGGTHFNDLTGDEGDEMSSAPLLSRVLQHQADKEATMARMLREGSAEMSNGDGMDDSDDDAELREKDSTIEIHAMNQRVGTHCGGFPSFVHKLLSLSLELELASVFLWPLVP